MIMFTGKMDAIRYGKIVEVGLVPFVRACFHDGHRLHQDNDPKHSSNHIKRFSNFMEFTGGKHHLSHQTLTPSKIVGAL